MNGLDFPIPASAAARRLTSFCLLAITVLVFQLVLRFDLSAQTGGAQSELAQLKTHGFAVVLGVMAMLNIAWFGALIRVQAAEARQRARAVAKSRHGVADRH
jgi:hypothetical protein